MCVTRTYFNTLSAVLVSINVVEVSKAPTIPMLSLIG